MTKLAKTIAAIGLILILGLIAWMVLGPKPTVFHISKVNFTVIDNLKSFSENGQVHTDALEITKKYENTRTLALRKASKYISERNTLNLLSNIFSIVSIISSFIISLFGANKGLYTKLEAIDSDIERAQGTELSFKKKLILFSAISILATTLSNRLSSYADKSQSTGYEIFEITKSADSKIANAISLNEVKLIAQTFELDVSKY